MKNENKVCVRASSTLRKRSRKPAVPLADDIVLDILSRLPAKDVLKCRRVCRRWNDLTSAGYFEQMHLKKHSSTPTVLVQEGNLNKDGSGWQQIVVNNWEPSKRITRSRKISFNALTDRPGMENMSRLIFCHDGLIIMRVEDRYPASVDFLIFNPNTLDRNEVRIAISAQVEEFTRLLAIFFHPFFKEYCVLGGVYGQIGGMHRKEQGTKIKMVNLGPSPSWRELKAGVAASHLPRLSKYQETDQGKVVDAPIVVDDIVYWMVGGVGDFRQRPRKLPSCEESIMMFDIKTEEFSLMTHPGPIKRCKLSKHLEMHLLKIDGFVSLVHCSPAHSSTMKITIWNLKDYAKRLWIKSHAGKINPSIRYIALQPRPFGFVNGELLLHWCTIEPLIAYNLKLRTHRMFGRRYKNALFTTHVKNSLVSLRNCKSEIEMENIGEEF